MLYNPNLNFMAMLKVFVSPLEEKLTFDYFKH